MTWLTEAIFKGFQYIIDNPDKALVYAVIIISFFLVKPIYVMIASIWEGAKFVMTKPKGTLLWIILLVVGLILLKSYGVI